jgi:hypothetical protein
VNDERESSESGADGVKIGKVYNFDMPLYPKAEWKKLTYGEQKQAFLEALRGDGEMKVALRIDRKKPSSATYTAVAVAPDHGELWIQLDAEMKALSDPVLQGLINGSIPWKRAGIAIAEEIAQIPHDGSPGQQINPSEVFRDFATAELDRRRQGRENLIKWAGIVFGFLGGNLSGALLVWKLSQE